MNSTSLTSDLLNANNTKIDISSISSLDLSNKNLTYIQRDTFQNLSSLITLNLKSNELACLETGVFTNLTKLFLLDLSSNKLTSLPNELAIFASLTNLNVLILESNGLEFPPPGLGREIMYNIISQLYFLIISNVLIHHIRLSLGMLLSQ